ncbi:hypothetical protein CTAYLR_010167, partial [Chrysophaeum taylorii]
RASSQASPLPDSPKSDVAVALDHPQSDVAVALDQPQSEVKLLSPIASVAQVAVALDPPEAEAEAEAESSEISAGHKVTFWVPKGCGRPPLVPFWTNTLYSKHLSGRRCLFDAVTLATGSSLTDPGLLKPHIVKVRDELGFGRERDPTFGLSTKAWERSKSPFEFTRQISLQCLLTKLFAQTVGVYIVLCAVVTLPDPKDLTKEILDQHYCVFDAYLGLFVVEIRGGNPNASHVTPDDLLDEQKTKANLKRDYGLLFPKHCYLLMINKKRVAETTYGSPSLSSSPI